MGPAIDYGNSDYGVLITTIISRIAAKYAAKRTWKSGGVGIFAIPCSIKQEPTTLSVSPTMSIDASPNALPHAF